MRQSFRVVPVRPVRRGAIRSVVTSLSVALVCSACETPQTTASAPAPPPPAEAPAPPPPPPSAPPTREEKERAQKVALDGLDQLQKGDEANARNLLGQALKLDPGNETARKLVDQITTDPQKELGPVFWKYTIRGNDSLASVAQRFMGDRLRFYILARYNGIAVPNKLAAGQVIKVPGKEPKNVAAPPAASPSPSPATPKPASTEPAPPKPEVQRPPEAPVPATPPPAPPPPPASTPAAEISRLSRAAEVCQSKQNLECAIDNWNKVLAIDPGNEQARYKRDSLIRMRDKLKQR